MDVEERIGGGKLEVLMAELNNELYTYDIQLDGNNQLLDLFSPTWSRQS